MAKCNHKNELFAEFISHCIIIHYRYHLFNNMEFLSRNIKINLSFVIYIERDNVCFEKKNVNYCNTNKNYENYVTVVIYLFRIFLHLETLLQTINVC